MLPAGHGQGQATSEVIGSDILKGGRQCNVGAADEELAGSPDLRPGHRVDGPEFNGEWPAELESERLIASNNSEFLLLNFPAKKVNREPQPIRSATKCATASVRGWT